MAKELHITEKIEQYLNGELQGTARTEFERAMQTDDALAKDVAAYDTLFKGFKGLQMQEKKNQVLAWQKEQAGRLTKLDTGNNTAAPVGVKRMNTRRRFLSFALAASILVAVFGLGLWWSSTQVSTPELIAGLVEVPKELAESRSTSNEVIGELAKGKAAFQQKQYGAAAQHFGAIADSSAQFTKAQYFLGHTYFQKKDYSQAATAFSKVASLKSPLLQEDAEWMTALAYLMSDNTAQKGKQTLSPILQNKNHKYHKQAAELKLKLE